MTDNELTTPILFLIFNQPKITATTFEEIRKARPKRLFISADGPRPERQGEAEDCLKTRDAVLKNIDWDCEVTTRILDTNIGCKYAVSSAITWFLDLVGEGIILEYDCVPSQSFFWFCQELLERYRHDTRIMAIGGTNGQLGIWRGESSYYFSRAAGIWGWATWKRAWRYWDGDVKSFPEFKKNNEICSIYLNPKVRKYFVQKFEEVYTGVNSSTWGFGWAYAVMVQNGLCVTPNVNLVSNIGFTDAGTHTINSRYVFAALPRQEIDVPNINHPRHIIPCIEADEYSIMKVIASERPSMMQRIKRPIRIIIPHRYRLTIKKLLARIGI